MTYPISEREGGDVRRQHGYSADVHKAPSDERDDLRTHMRRRAGEAMQDTHKIGHLDRRPQDALGGLPQGRGEVPRAFGVRVGVAC